MLHGRSLGVVVVPAVLGSLATITVLFRCYVRIRIVNRFGWDDGFMATAMITNLMFALCGIIGGVYGIGRKTEDFHDRPKDFQRAMLCWWLGQLSYAITATIMRVSIGLTLARFAPSKVHLRFLYGIIVLSTLTGVLLFFFATFQCSPVSYYWDKTSGQGICHNDIEVKIIYFYSVIDAVFDLAIGILPALFISHLLLDRSDKIAIAGLLGLGCLALAAVIARAPFVHLMTEESFLYETTMVAITSDIETSVGIIAGSFMVMRPAFSMFTKSKAKGLGKCHLTTLTDSQMTGDTLKAEA
ncbi:hypothetical protein BDV37DRAFT_284870 [Aspergillus pseudonomiae]|uniref:Rhodopsin domain-containing protein n=1 Tax=Aspergillus pseudonomiae TaxID=1506151 RepID=A0A5N7D714_9EURO|nr:uncharacterized protein BDV37DRAFT_284870 [Aspergillus pseudonomiae]KAE8402222.1 hypothetical protein BDV37DRAFT_284870 [Aspergillus pseudonomiae]